MLIRAVYRDLTDIVRFVALIRQRLDEGADTPELDLLARSCSGKVRHVAVAIGEDDAEHVTKLQRHLHWLVHYHGRGEPEGYLPDVADITQRDLPGVIELVEQWERGLLAAGLVDAVSASWDDHNYVNAVRDGFVYLEETLREVGGVPPDEGLSGDQLINRLLAPTSAERIDLSGSGVHDPRTKGEQQGVFHLFKGAFLLFRNPAAHRFIDYEAEEGDEVLRLVNLCLRILGRNEAPATNV